MRFTNQVLQVVGEAATGSKAMASKAMVRAEAEPAAAMAGAVLVVGDMVEGVLMVQQELVVTEEAEDTAKRNMQKKAMGTMAVMLHRLGCMAAMVLQQQLQQQQQVVL